MKKKLNIIVLLTLVVLTLFTFGCKKEVEAGADVRAWNISAQDGACGDQVVTLKVEKGDIPWFCWTLHQADGGYIQTAGEGYDIYKYVSGGDHFGEKVNNITTLENGNTYIFKFGVKGNYDLYIHQPTAEKSVGGTKDFRGKVKVEGNTVHLKDSGYKDITGKNVELYITNNEPNSSSSWREGNYTITELWPLVPTDAENTISGSTWKVDQNLKYAGLEFTTGTYGFLFPIEQNKDLLVAMYQPLRNKKMDGTDAAYTTPASGTSAEVNIKTYYAKIIKYADIADSRKIGPISSSSFGLGESGKQFTMENQVFTAKSALGTVEYYTVSDVPEGMAK